MNTPIVVLTGPMASGKSTLAKHLQQQKQAVYVNTREALSPTLPAQPPQSRKNLQDAGVQLDKKTNGRWVLALLQQSIVRHPSAQLFVIDSVRNPRQLAAIKSKHRDRLTVVHLTSPNNVLANRYRNRGENVSYTKAVKHPSESRVNDLRKAADIVIDTEFNHPQHVCDIVAAHILSTIDP